MIGDIPIDRGTCIIPSFDFNHTCEKYYKDALTIRPERWFNGETENNEPYTFVPFSAGARNCIGQHLAMMEARLILIHFIKSYTYKIKQPF
jgi:cytochrome P450